MFAVVLLLSFAQQPAAANLVCGPKCFVRRNPGISRIALPGHAGKRFNRHYTPPPPLTPRRFWTTLVHGSAFRAGGGQFGAGATFAGSDLREAQFSSADRPSRTTSATMHAWVRHMSLCSAFISPPSCNHPRLAHRIGLCRRQPTSGLTPRLFARITPACPLHRLSPTLNTSNSPSLAFARDRCVCNQ